MIVSGFFVFIISCTGDSCYKTRVDSNAFRTQQDCVDSVLNAVSKARPLPAGVSVDCSYDTVDDAAPILQEHTINGIKQPSIPLPNSDFPTWDSDDGWKKDGEKPLNLKL